MPSSSRPLLQRQPSIRLFPTPKASRPSRPRPAVAKLNKKAVVTRERTGGCLATRALNRGAGERRWKTEPGRR